MRAILVQMELAWIFATSLLRYGVEYLLGREGRLKIWACRLGAGSFERVGEVWK